ncbi:unnamed protein product [Ascophyllum nodosum]
MVSHPPSEEVTPAPAPMDISPTQRMLSACAGVLTTNLLVTPMDVVKTRVQAAQAESVNRQVASSLSNSGYQEACEICHQQGRLYTTSARAPSAAAAATAAEVAPSFEVGAGGVAGRLRPPPPLPSGTWAALRHIAKWEGPRGLYRGIDVSLVMAVPSTVLYYTMYDDILGRLDRAGVGSVLGPMTAGAIARVLATMCMAPLELVRTRIQAQRATTTVEEEVIGGGREGARAGKRAIRSRLSDFPIFSIAKEVSTVVRKEGALALWRGVGTTMWRDVPFSMVYWLGYENLKAGLGCNRRSAGREGNANMEGTGQSLADQRGSADFLLRSFTAGAISGVVASLLTHPFDVVKTQQQLVVKEVQGGGSCEHRPAPPRQPRRIPGTFEVMRNIVDSRGIAGLYTGALPRVGKVAPACAIMIFSYEAGKRFFAERNAERARLQ